MHIGIFVVFIIIIAALLAVWVYNIYQKFFYVEDGEEEPSFLKSTAGCILFFEVINLAIITIITFSVSNFGEIELTKVPSDTEPASYQYLIPFEINKEKVFFVENGDAINFVLGGSRPGPIVVTSIETKGEACELSYDCLEAEEPYAEIHVLEIKYQRRLGFIYMPVGERTDYQYILHLHSQ